MKMYILESVVRRRLLVSYINLVISKFQKLEVGKA